MIDVGDKVVVTDVPEGCGLEGIEVGKVGEVVRWCDGISVDILFGDGKKFLGFIDEEEYLKSKNYGYTHVFLVEKFDNKEDSVGEALTVEEVIKSVIEGNACGNKPNKALTTDNEDTFKVGEDNGEGNHTNVRGSSLASQNMPINGVQGFSLEETETYIEEKQDTKESDNTPKEGVYNTIIKKDGLTIYTNYSVEVVGEAMRVGGVDDLVSNFDDSEEG